MYSENRGKILFLDGSNYLLLGLGSGHVNVVVLNELRHKHNYDNVSIDLIPEPQNVDDRTHRY